MKRKIPKPMSRLEESFVLQLKAVLPHVPVVREYKFHPKRKWRADFCIPRALGMQSILIEIDGGVFNRGRHVTGAGFTADVEKLNAAALMGFLILRGTAHHVRSGQLLAWVEEALR